MGLVWLCHDGEMSTSVMFVICYCYGTRGGGLSVMRAILGCAAQVCLLAAVLCGSPAIVCPFLMSAAGGLLL